MRVLTQKANSNTKTHALARCVSNCRFKGKLEVRLDMIESAVVG
jgi:hypothetical protein